uniref:Uncharacterized protein n=1 Tax=Oxyrrhis marina TaxID=2969 RepID=A0A7S3XFL7_OXYMA
MGYLFITLAVTASLSTDGSSPPREQAIGRELQSDFYYMRPHPIGKCDHFPDLCKCGANERAHHFYDANGHVLGTVCSAKCSSSECHPTPFSVLGVQCLSEQCFIICNDHSQCQSDDGTPAKCGPYDPKIKARVCYFPTPK